MVSDTFQGFPSGLKHALFHGEEGLSLDLRFLSDLLLEVLEKHTFIKIDCRSLLESIVNKLVYLAKSLAENTLLDLKLYGCFLEVRKISESLLL